MSRYDGFIFSLIAVAILALGVYFQWQRYHECRQHFSVFYCLTSK